MKNILPKDLSKMYACSFHNQKQFNTNTVDSFEQQNNNSSEVTRTSDFPQRLPRSQLITHCVITTVSLGIKYPNHHCFQRGFRETILKRILRFFRIGLEKVNVIFWVDRFENLDEEIKEPSLYGPMSLKRNRKQIAPN